MDASVADTTTTLHYLRRRLFHEDYKAFDAQRSGFPAPPPPGPEMAERGDAGGAEGSPALLSHGSRGSRGSNSPRHMARTKHANRCIRVLVVSSVPAWARGRALLIARPWGSRTRLFTPPENCSVNNGQPRAILPSRCHPAAYFAAFSQVPEPTLAWITTHSHT